ncbi:MULTISPECIES: alpha/beta hydrolase [Streptomyces]|uniref:alpha/beta hydrolase n=1 Tax=Streptomyces TaxID=1883 RepID=UPI0029BC2200|nr:MULTISPECIES: alpha/beta hydrolase [unclassified Streptomyces]MDX3086657.1 alpha/beta hydrolase [Streptomyces sp. ME12-02E]MDX3330041.1 alpha/beta hydrolase [Streptomyces sp. ME02-6978a]
MSLHPEIASFLATLPPPPEGPLDPVAMRAADEAHVAPPEKRQPLHAVEDLAVPTAAGEVPVRVYTPDAAERHGLLLYFHGGAFFLGSLNTHDHVCRALAAETGLKVVSVGYRLAPEAAFPAGLEDCYAVLRWAAENGERLGWDGTTLALAGDSSGGTFAAAVAALAHDDGFEKITHQILYYPSLDLDFDTGRYASLRENAEGYGLETAGLKPFNAFYLDSGADPADPRVSPIKRADLAGLPPALVVTAEHDPLRDEGELYGSRLREAGVPTTVTRYAGANHGFVQHFSWIPEYREVFAHTREFLTGGGAS